MNKIIKTVQRWLAISLPFLVVGSALAFTGGSGPQAMTTKRAALSLRKPAIAEMNSRRMEAKKRPDLAVSWNDERGVPSIVKGPNLLSNELTLQGASSGMSASSNFEGKAVQVMKSLGGMYGIRDAQAEFSAQSAELSMTGSRHVRMNQLYKGLRVFGGQVIVHFDGKGMARTVNGNYCPISNLDTTPVLTADRAASVATSDQKSLSNPEGVVTNGPELQVFAWESDPVLAYRLEIHYQNAVATGRWCYWIDARTGEILLRYNNVPQAAPGPGAAADITGNLLTSEGGASVHINGFKETVGNYYLYSQINRWYLINWPTQDYVYRNTPTWGTSDRIAISAGFNCQSTEDYYQLVHSWSGVNGAGMRLVANIHRTGMANAFWNGTTINLFDELPCALDVVGHEVTHGVTQFTAGLIYAGESGALNESISDIFGTLIEFRTQTMGTNTYPNTVPGRADWVMGEDTGDPIRDMERPARYGQPSKYKGTRWDPAQEVHQNSGVQNFFFYLLCVGGSGNNDGLPYFVPGIGIDAGGKVAFLALTQYMTPGTDYKAARDAWVAAGKELDDAAVTTGAEVGALLAWAAVGVGNGATVQPAWDFASGGEPGTPPYIASNRVYTLINAMPSNLTWSIYTDGQPAWLNFSTSSVTMTPGQKLTATVSVDQAVAATMPAGTYFATVNFTNDFANGNTTRRAILRISDNYTIASTNYNWIDPVSGGHAVVPCMSGVSEAYPLPFPLTMYDVAWSNLYITPYGLVGVTNSMLDTEANTDFPESMPPNGILCPLWDALDARRLPARVYYKELGQAPNRKVVITWLNASLTNELSSIYSFQMIIPEATSNANPNNDIIFQYKDVAEQSLQNGSGQGATIGIEDEYGAMRKKYSYNGERWLASETALRFTRLTVVDTNAPEGSIKSMGGTGSTATFEVKFNEPVEGFGREDVITNSTIPGIALGSIVGGGMRYLVPVTNIHGLGRVVMGVVGDAVADWAGNSNAPFGPAIYVVPMDSINFSDDMERGPANWTASTDVYDQVTANAWEWGVPNYFAGPALAASGTHCWGTVLTGDYPNGMNAWVEAPPIDVGPFPVLEFSLWYDLQFMDGPQDMGYVEVDGGAGFVNVTPGGFYSGTSPGWIHQQIVLDNAAFGNRTIHVRFRATSDYDFTMAGMYVDDVVVRSQRAPGIWVSSYAPTNGAPSSPVPVQIAAYNSSTSSFGQVIGDVSCAYAGVGILPSSVPVQYGAMEPGQVVTGGAPVQVVLAAAGNFQDSIIRLTHRAMVGLVEMGLDVLPFKVDGVTSVVATNVISVTSGTGVTNWLGRYLPGNGANTSCLYQVIGAGSNGVPDAPTPSGQVTGDDQLLYSFGPGVPWGRFGEGAGIPANLGQFLNSFNHGIAPGTKVFVRAWDANSFSAAAAYGDSSLYSILPDSFQAHDFGSWIVATPLASGHDSNGDGIPDAYCVTNGMDPRQPIAGLTSNWSLAQSPLGSAGTGPQQFNGTTPSPTRLFYKDNFLYVLDTGNNRIQIWNRFTREYKGAYGTQGTGEGSFRRPVGLALDPILNSFAVADQVNHQIQVFSFDPSSGTNIAFQFQFGADTLQKPTDVAIDAYGWFYVTDVRTGQADVDVPGPNGVTNTVTISVDQSEISMFDESGFYWGALASSGTETGKVINPGGICIGTNDSVIVADTGNNRVQSFDMWTGNVLWPTNGTNTASFSLPMGVAIGPGQQVYVADTGNSQIKILHSDGRYAATLGSHGYGFQLLLNHPYGLAPVADSNLVFVADTYNNRVLSIVPIYDQDADGIDDVWELLHGLDPSNPTDATLVDPFYGIPYIGVYRLGLSPSAAPATPLPIRITAFSVTPPLLQWDIVTNGGIYQVEYSYDSWSLASNSWMQGPVYTSGLNGTFGVSDLSFTNKIQYIRVKRLSP